MRKVLVIKNSGNATLQLSAPVVRGAFSVSALPDSLAPGASAQLWVTMLTTHIGRKDGKVELRSNTGTFRFFVRGQVITQPTNPEIEIVGVIDGQRNPVYFGEAQRGDRNPEKSFVIRNVGRASLRISNVSVPRGYRVVSSPTKYLRPGATTTLKVQLLTSQSGEWNGEIVISNSDSDEGRFNFPVTGKVNAAPILAPEIEIVGVAKNQIEAVSVGAAHAGESLWKQFVVRNTGRSTLEIRNVRHSSAIREVRVSQSDIRSGGSAILSVRMDTTRYGQKSGWIRFTTNDSDERSVTINLTGVVLQNNHDTSKGPVRWTRVIESGDGFVEAKWVETYRGSGNRMRIFADFYNERGSLIRRNVAIGDHSDSGDQSIPALQRIETGNVVFAWAKDNPTTTGGIHFTILDPWGHTKSNLDRRANNQVGDRFSIVGIETTDGRDGFTLVWRRATNNGQWIARRDVNSSGTPTSGVSESIAYFRR